MKAEIILTDKNISVDLNEPTINVSAEDSISVTVIGGVGPQGPRGYTPICGTDYWTEEDKQTVTRAAIDAVLAVYPAAEEVVW